MRSDLRDKFNQLFLPHSRYVLISLLAANMVVGVYLANRDELPKQAAVSLPAIDPELRLVDVHGSSPSNQPVTEQSENQPRECRVWGPEPNPEAFSDLAKNLRAQGGFPEIVTTRVSVRSEYLVYIDRLDSTSNAKQTAKELQALDIENYLMIREDDSPVLSVGVFSSESRAQRQLQRVSELGYRVTVEELSRSQTVYNMTAHVFPQSHAYDLSTSTCAMIAQG